MEIYVHQCSVHSSVCSIFSCLLQSIAFRSRLVFFNLLSLWRWSCKSPYYSAEMHTQFTCRQTTWERGRIYCLKDLSFKQAKTASGKFFFSHFEMWNITYPPLCRPHSWRQLRALDTGTRKKSPSFQRRYEFGHDMTITHARVIFKPIYKYFDDRMLLAEHSRKVGSLRAC